MVWVVPQRMRDIRRSFGRLSTIFKRVERMKGNNLSIGM